MYAARRRNIFARSGVAAALALVAGCSDSPADLAGVYEAHYGSFTLTRVDAETMRVRMPLKRVSSLRDIALLTECVAEADRPAAGPIDPVQGVANPESLITAIELEADGSAEVIVIRDHELENSCVLAESDEFSVEDGTLVFAKQKLTVRYERADDDTLILEHDFREPAPNVENLLISGTNYDWLVGRWRRNDQPAETLTVSKSPSQVTHVTLRQVGTPGDAEFPFPMLCRIETTGENPTVRTMEDAEGISRVVLEFAPVEHNLVENEANAAACETFVNRENESLTGRRIEIAIERGDDDTLRVDGAEIFGRDS